MKFLLKHCVRILCLWVILGALPVALHAADLLPTGLRELAGHATQRETWPKLRNYAKTQTDKEWRGWALFLAGYQEFQGQVYAQGAVDLAQAAQTEFSLSDYALFYQASALRQSSRPQDAAIALQDFASRFPRSQLLDQALELRVASLLSSEQTQPAIEALLADPAVRKEPQLALLLGQAYTQVKQFGDAATAYQNIYFSFPASPQAKAAGEALSSLRNQMGTGYPEPSGELKAARAKALFQAGRFTDALKDYGDLLRAEPSNPAVPNWLLGQARCLWRLQRSADVLQELLTHFDSPELESQRLELLVHVHAQQSDARALAQDIAEFEASYSSYPAYSDALSAAGFFYFRQFNWQEAARIYQRLGELFPQNEHLRDDGWRLGWCDYLLGDAKTAEVMHAYLMQFPDSARAPAALYWLGRVEEDQGAITEARALYALLINRFAHAYYAPHAAAHLATLRTRQVSVAESNDSAAAPLAASLIPVLTRPVVPAGLACAHVNPSEAGRPALILRALNLPTLEQDYLKGAVAKESPPAELRLLLAGAYSAQDNPANAMFATLKATPGYSQMEFSDLPEEVWDLLYPKAYSTLIQTQARLNNLDPYLVMGLIRQESAFSAHALSVANARGLMQVLPQTAAETTRTTRVRLAGQRLYDPNYNVRVGCAYLAGLFKEFDGHPEFAVAAYNAGDFRVKDWVKKYTFRDQEVFLESIPITETRIYVEQVLRDADVYRQLLSNSPRFAQCSQAQPAGPVQTSSATFCDDLVSTLGERVPGE